MPEHLKALAVILVLAAVVFGFVKAPACVLATTTGDFERRRNLWFGITLALFLAHNYWIFMIVVAALLLFALPREPNKLAMSFFLLFASPPLTEQIPGLGIINHFFTIDYLRLLALTILLPAFLHLRKQPDVERFGRLLPDKLIAGYIILQFLLLLQASTFTNVLRHGAFYAFLDVFLPYYVASRALRNLQGFRDALTAFVVAALVLSAIAAFEFAKHWLLYFTLHDVLGISHKAGVYFGRGESLRAVGSARQPVPLGYALAVAMGMFLYLRILVSSRMIWRFGFALLIVGLIAALSRGPWVGAATMVLVFIAIGPSPVRDFAKLGLLGAIVLPVLLITPAGEKIIDLLPFVGAVDAENVSYRMDFTRISISFILANPWFGAYDYIYAPEMEVLKPQGLLDTLNVFLTVGLGSGLVGMSLFSGVFIAAGAGVFKTMRNQADRNGETYLLGQALLSTLLGMIVILCTISGISIIPVIYWSVVGLCIAYARMLETAKGPARELETAKPSRIRPLGMKFR